MNPNSEIGQTGMSAAQPQTGMSAPLSLPRVGSRLLYTLTGANARIAMSESAFGRHLREGDVRPLIVTHEPSVYGDGEAVTVSGEVLTGRGVMLPVGGVPLVREPSPGAAHWPPVDVSLVAVLEDRAEPRIDAPLKQPSGAAAPRANDALVTRNAELHDELERRRAHETHLIMARDELLQKLSRADDERANLVAELRAVRAEVAGLREMPALTPPIHGASVKVMRSHDYCHFEVRLSSSDAATLEAVDALRKEAARLADKAVAQYKTAKAAAEVLGEMRSKNQLSWAERTPKSERTPTQKAIIKFHQDAAFAARFEYDYQDDYEGPTPEDLDNEE